MSNENTLDQKRETLASLRQQVAALEVELNAAEDSTDWQHQGGFYSAYYATTGFMLGGIAAMASLLFNVIGSTIVGQHPLRIISVYLTFPLGEQALELTSGKDSAIALKGGLMLALGCCLYVGTGMVLGALFHWVICRFALRSSLTTRLIWASGLAIVVWVVNYYLILSWLQPMVCNGGSWITDNSYLPWYVAVATHLVFGWSMAVFAPAGAFVPYKRPTETAAE
ncbi:MAG: hypothetical protein KDA85_15450 [Planctomycetaceae bacterium]|nr:hypothetical protein [Planctomycetaceae bacterium]